jgi:hypothetical protein
MLQWFIIRKFMGLIQNIISIKKTIPRSELGVLGPLILRMYKEKHLNGFELNALVCKSRGKRPRVSL